VASTADPSPGPRAVGRSAGSSGPPAGLSRRNARPARARRGAPRPHQLGERHLRDPQHAEVDPSSAPRRPTAQPHPDLAPGRGSATWRGCAPAANNVKGRTVPHQVDTAVREQPDAGAPTLDRPPEATHHRGERPGRRPGAVHERRTARPARQTPAAQRYRHAPSLRAPPTTSSWTSRPGEGQPGAKWSQPTVPSYGRPSTVTRCPRPPCRSPRSPRQSGAGREGRRQRVVLAAVSVTPGVGAQRGGHLRPAGGPAARPRPAVQGHAGAAAIWPRSASNPSEVSIIAVAPHSAAARTAAYGGAGTRCAPTTSTGERTPVGSTASPAAAQPSRPATASTSPGRAPDGFTGSRPCRSPSTVTASTTSRRTPRRPDHARADRGRLRPQAGGQLLGHRRRGTRGAAEADQQRVGVAPSPRCRPCSRRRPCDPPARGRPVETEVHASTSTSVLASTRPSGAATSARRRPAEQGARGLAPAPRHPPDQPELPHGGHVGGPPASAAIRSAARSATAHTPFVR